MTATVSFTPAPGCSPTVCGNAESGSISLTFNPIYNQGGALSRIAGNWQDVETGQIINVNGAGVVFSQEAATGLAFVDSSVTPNRAYFAGQYRVGNTAYTTYAYGPKVGG